ncbi:MAG: AMP-binding protein [Acidobacteria bacterium]|nr:AMP-binding protein [Acidobacteriota bacterium]
MSYRFEPVPETSEAEGASLLPTVTQSIVRQAAERTGMALHDQKTGRRISYHQLASATRHAAKALALRGFQKGQVVCLYSPNLPEYAVAVLAVTLAGGVVTLAVPTLEPELLARQLAATHSQWLVTTKRHLSKALLAASQTAVRHVYSFDPALGAQHIGELFETIIADDERPTEALLDPQRDLMAWLFDETEPGTRYPHAAVAALLQARAWPANPLEIKGASLAQAEVLWDWLAALQHGMTVLI